MSDPDEDPDLWEPDPIDSDVVQEVENRVKVPLQEKFQGDFKEC